MSCFSTLVGLAQDLGAGDGLRVAEQHWEQGKNAAGVRTNLGPYRVYERTVAGAGLRAPLQMTLGAREETDMIRSQDREASCGV